MNANKISIVERKWWKEKEMFISQNKNIVEREREKLIVQTVFCFNYDIFVLYLKTS